MRRWMAAPLVFATVAALSCLTPSLSRAQNNGPEEETFTTADGIQLHGLFHKSQKNPGNDPVVIMLYPPGKDNSMLKGDWGGLANRLTKEGYNVFRFDWRGHGKSFDIKDVAKFWTNPATGSWNMRYIKGANIRPIKDTFYFKDLISPVSYTPVYLNDLAAARAHLDSKNDTGEVNMSSIYLIGSEDATSLGLAWLAAEWNRPAKSPTPNQLGLAPRYEFVPQPLRGSIDPTGGEDISGCVWLSPTRPASFPASTVKGFISGIMPNGRLPLAPKTRDNNPMLFMFAADDKKGTAQANFFHNEVLVGKGNKNTGLRALNEKFFQPVKADQLVGVALLGDDEKRGVEGNILKFLDAQQAQRKAIVRKPREYNGPYYIKLDSFGLYMSQ